MSGTGLTGLQNDVRRFLSKPPEQFSYPYVREWVQDSRTRTALKTAVLNAFNGSDDQSSEETAAAVFAEIALEDRRKASAFIDSALQFLALTISIHLTIGEKLVLDAINTQAEQAKQQFDELAIGQAELSAAVKEIGRQIERNIASTDASQDRPLAQDALDEFIQRYLERVLRRRWFSETLAVDDLMAIAKRLDDGLTRLPRRTTRNQFGIVQSNNKSTARPSNSMQRMALPTAGNACSG